MCVCVCVCAFSSLFLHLVNTFKTLFFTSELVGYQFYQCLHHLQPFEFWKNETFVFKFQHCRILEILFHLLISIFRKLLLFLKNELSLYS